MKENKVKCPFCGYSMPVSYSTDSSECRGVFIRCKGRGCRREFEIVIRKNKQMIK